MSNTGYLKDSPDRFNPMNVIPSRNITMKNVLHPVLGIDNKGNVKLMSPGKDYKFKGNKVTEIPLRNSGKNLQHGILQNGGDYVTDWSNPSDIEWTQQQIGNQMTQMGAPTQDPVIDGQRLQGIKNTPLQKPTTPGITQTQTFNADPFKLIHVPGTEVGPSSTAEDRPEDWSGMGYAMTSLIGMGAFNQMLQKKNKNFYDEQMRKFGNTNQQPTNNPENPYGDFTLNNSVGANFRPNQYQDGGEYDLSDAEIDRLRNEGYDIEFL